MKKTLSFRQKAKLYSKYSLLGKEELLKRLKLITEVLRETYGVNQAELIGLADSSTVVPLTVFCEKLSPLESVVKFLHENRNKSFSEISKLINRSYRTVWGAYEASLKKNKKRFEPEQTKYVFPTEILASRRLSVLETICLYIKDNYGLSYKRIASLIKRDERTVWTAVNRARTKLRKKKRKIKRKK